MTEKVRFALQEVGMEAEDSAPYLLQLLGVQEGTESLAHLTPDAIRLRTFDTLRQLSLKGSQQRPLIVEIEDLHWIDHTSQDYLASFVESLPGAAMLLLTSYRPGYRPPWIEKSYATQVSLHHLTSQNAVTIVHATRQQQALPEHLEHMILDKAQGNPFFLEELTHAVIEHGDLQKDVVVPDTIQGVLSARIDRLPRHTSACCKQPRYSVGNLLHGCCRRYGKRSRHWNPCCWTSSDWNFSMNVHEARNRSMCSNMP